MKSKASYFSVSGVLIRENLRRFWALPTITFLVYFFSSVFPMLIYLAKLDKLARYIDLCLHNQQPFFMIAHLLTPIFAAIIVFRYLQSTPGATVMHSLPFNKSLLFNSGLISGLIMISSPIVLNGLLLLLINRPTFLSWDNTVNVFTVKAVVIWMGSSLLIVTFIYIIAVFGGMVTGNSILHLIGAGGFNFLLPALYGTFVLYFTMYLYGFDPSGDWWRTVALLSPYSEVVSSSGNFTTKKVLGYSIAILVITIVSAVLYHKRKLEKAGDAMAFRFMEPIICYLITFFGMTAMGFYFNALGEGPTDRANYFTYLGFALGTIIFFVIGRMTVKKTLRVFNKDSLKSLAIYIAIAGLFLTGLSVDATGFEKRVPDIAKVDSVVVDGNAINSALSHTQTSINFRDSENMKHIASFHKSVIENKKRFLDNETIHKLYVTLKYKKGKQRYNRSYNIDYNFLAESPHLKALCESKEYKDFLSPSGLGEDGFSSITLYAPSGNDNIYLDIGDGYLALLEAYEKDFRAMSFEEIISPRKAYMTLSLSYYKILPGQSKDKEQYYSVEYPITASCINSIKWLKEKGYWKQIVISPDKITRIEIYESTGRNPYDYHYMDDKSGKPIMIVYDKKQIQLLMEHADRFAIDETSFHYGKVYLTTNHPEDSDYDYPIDMSDLLFFNNGIMFLAN